jgi:glycosyltransferase involved in cell wall biosynthesis
MRIRFFNTHEPVTSFYRDLLPALARRGHDVEVYLSAAEYRPGRGSLPKALHHPGLRIRYLGVPGLRARRRRNRAWIMLAYAVQAAAASLRARRADVNVFLTQPPLFALWGWALKLLRGERYYCVIMDLYPEAAIQNGNIRAGGGTARTLNWLAHFAWSQAEGVVVIGRCQAEKLAAAGIPREKIHFIPNWVNPRLVHPVAPSQNKLRKALGLEAAFVVLYSGNMGLAHEFNTLLGAAERLSRHPGIRVVLIGDGARRPEVELEIKSRHLRNIVLLPFQPAARLAESLSLGDVHVVTLRDGFEGVVVPSKAYGAQAVGRPLIYIGHPSGEIARMVNEARIGTVVSSGDAAALARAILRYSRSPSLQQAEGRKAFALYQKRYHPRNSLTDYRRLLNGNRHDQ